MTYCGTCGRLMPGEEKPAASRSLTVDLYIGEKDKLRRVAVSRGWFEVPAASSWEILRMVDPATGGQLVVYDGKRGMKAVANTGQSAARELLEAFRKRP